MKTPLTYYGGKQMLAPLIIKLFPEHRLYGEVFVGGGAVFFMKEPSAVEVINDVNSELINFYKQVKYNFVELEKEIYSTLHSRQLHADAIVVYNNPHLFTEKKRAWAVWANSALGFGGMLDSSFGYDKSKNTTSKKIRNKRESFTIDLANRLCDVQIESADALRIIRTRDTNESFFYCDPPYFNSDMGHYDGYTVEDFIMLLETLEKIKGKFLLSSYPSPQLSEYIKKNGWSSWSKKMRVTVGNKSGKAKTKQEVLTANYPLDEAKLKADGWVLNK